MAALRRQQQAQVAQQNRQIQQQAAERYSMTHADIKAAEKSPAPNSQQTRNVAEPRQLRISDTTSAAYKKSAPFYVGAAAKLIDMLDEKMPCDVKQAIFIVENAYYGNTLSYANYCVRIDTLVQLCKKKLAAKGTSVENKPACHQVIQSLFPGKASRLGYDFDDFWGENDFSKQFVIKLLRTHKGQCHSLPLLYLILANELNAPAFLALAPNHSYVKFPGEDGTLHNFETTSGHVVTDDWLMASGYITPFAVRNRIYLAPLSEKELIAQCLADLASSFVYKFGQDRFVTRCADEALKAAPHCLAALQLRANMSIANCAATAKRYGFPRLEGYKKHPDLQKQYDTMLAQEKAIEALGYQRIPPEAYAQWQKTAQEEKQKQESKCLTTPSPSNPKNPKGK